MNTSKTCNFSTLSWPRQWTLLSIVALFMAVGSTQASGTFPVSPSGGDDTAALQQAFDDAVAAGPGSVVQLQSGDYCITAPVIVRGFDGDWVGAGRNKTFVRTCTAPAPFPVPAYIQADPAFPADPLLEIISPFVFLEIDGSPSINLSIADMTIHLEGETNPWLAHGRPEPLTIFRPAILVAGARPSVVDGIVSSATLSVDGVELRANAEGFVFDMPSDSNIDNGIVVQGGVDGTIFETFDVEPVNATVSITRSHFDRVAFSALQTPWCVDCDITVGGSKKMGNTFSLLYGAPLFGSSIGMASTVVVSHNMGEAQFGAVRWVALPVFFSTTPLAAPTEPSYIEVSKNKIDIFSHFINPSYGMYLDDYSLYFDTKAMQAYIHQNTIDQVDIGYGTEAFAGVLHLTGEDTLIQNNKISGDFILGGIVAGFAGPGAVGKNLLIKANNLKGSTGGMAPIWLGPETSDSVVVGGPNKTQVLDEGTNNIITGVKKIEGNSPGQRIREAVQTIHEFRDKAMMP